MTVPRIFAKEDLAQQAVVTAVLAFLYGMSFAVVVYVLNPVQEIFFPDVTKFASLVFIPHGIRVLATVVLGGRAIPGLFIGALLSNYFIWHITDTELLLLVALVSCGTSWAVFEALHGLRINAYYLSSDTRLPAFHTVLLAGIVCSFANGFLMTAILEMTGNITHITLTMAAYAIGDAIGLVVCWIFAKMLFDHLPINAK